MVAPLPEMRIKVQAILDHWRFATVVSALDVHRMMDTIQYMAPLIARGCLCCRPIQWWAIGAWETSEDWSQHFHVPDWVLRLLAWWASPAVCQGLSLEMYITDITLYTDASLYRWRVQLGDHSISGHWSAAQLGNHIIVLINAVRVFLHKLVHSMCDNTTVVLYIKQEGGTKLFRVTSLTTRLLKYCGGKGIIIIPVHCWLMQNSGRWTVAAGRDTAEGVGNRSQFTGSGVQMMGYPWIDLFVTFSNRKCQQFVSPYPNPWAGSSKPCRSCGAGWERWMHSHCFKMIPAVVAKRRQSPWYCWHHTGWMQHGCWSSFN